MIAKAIETIRGIFADAGQRAEKVAGRRNREILLITNGSHGPGDLHEIAYDTPSVKHEMNTIESLVQFIIDHGHAKQDTPPNTLVFMEPGRRLAEWRISAALRYRDFDPSTANVALLPSPEYLALEALFGGVSQRDLWRLLITDLRDMVDESLLLGISSLRASLKDEKQVDISPLGLGDAKGARRLKLTFAAAKGEGSLSQDLPTEWTFTIPIWESWTSTYEIKTTLEIDTSDGLAFVFHPRRLHEVIRQARTDVAGYLRQSLPNIDVYDGKF